MTYFIEYVSRGAWKRAKHLDLLCHVLEEVAKGNILRVIITLPPRHGKSETTSKHFPAWFLGKYPDEDVILTSYAADLAEDHSRKAREILREYGESIFGISLSSDSSAVNRWGIEGHRGGLIAAGVGGPITGRGAKVAIIDDPFKGPEDSHSPTQRQKVINWYKSVLRTRLAPGGAIIVMHTRWHEEDLVGYLLNGDGGDDESDRENWVVINLPAIAEEDDPLGREPGEPLWPERFPLEELNKLRRAAGSYYWAALYQQRPSPEGGGMLRRNWWKFYRVAPRFEEMIQTWDCAFKDEGDTSYVVGQVWGRVGADKYLVDQVRDKMDLPATMRAIYSLSNRWPNTRAKLIEDKANGTAVIQMLNRKIPGLIPIEPAGGKIVRARAVSPEIESGNVYLPDPEIAPWVHDFIEECAAFPSGRHNDQVDAMTQALNWLAEHARGIDPSLGQALGRMTDMPGFGAPETGEFLDLVDPIDDEYNLLTM